jgi:hypothetical protein
MQCHHHQCNPAVVSAVQGADGTSYCWIKCVFGTDLVCKDGLIVRSSDLWSRFSTKSPFCAFFYPRDHHFFSELILAVWRLVCSVC